MRKTEYKKFIKENISECDVSYRGGTLAVNVSELFPEIEGTGEDAIMGASQNYLGGGIAGQITSGAMFDKTNLTEKNQKVYEVLAREIRLYFYNVNNGGGDEYMQEEMNSFEFNQGLPISGY